jgi:hypothetical protein
VKGFEFQGPHAALEITSINHAEGSNTESMT